MKKKATLLIQHLECIYTMIPPNYGCVYHGFLAVHHEVILAIGEGEGWQWVDKDTRIIEGRGHIVIPAMIDVGMQFPMFHKLDSECDRKIYKSQNSLHELIRYTHENSEILMRHGTLIANLNQKPDEIETQILEQFKKSSELDFIAKHVSTNYPIVKPLAKIPSKKYRRFCISTGYEAGVIECLDQFLCAKLYYQYTKEDPMRILAACTIYPALALGLSNYGSLAKGNIANMVILEGKDVQQGLSSFSNRETMQIMKEGTRIYPNIII